MQPKSPLSGFLACHAGPGPGAPDFARQPHFWPHRRRRGETSLCGAYQPHLTNTEDYSYQETTSAKLKYMGTVRGRLGYALGQFLPYATGGFAWGRMTLSTNWRLHQFNQVADLPFIASESHTHVGWTLGAGFEYAFAEHWSAKAEYLYVDLGKETYFDGVQGGGSFGMQDHTVRIGINFRP